MSRVITYVKLVFVLQIHVTAGTTYIHVKLHELPQHPF